MATGGTDRSHAPTPTPRKEGEKVLANGNDRNGPRSLPPVPTSAAWKIVTALTLAGVCGIVGLLWNINAKIAVIEATMVSEVELSTIMNTQLPAPWFRSQVDRIERKLDDHIRQTAEIAHGRGGDQ